VAVHLTPDQIAALLEVETDVVLNAADEVGVPVYQGQIDRVLFAEALAAAGHHLGDVAAERLLRAGDASSG
jgi:L-asparaginase II